MSERTKELIDAITAYLCGGGLFNPELADHNAVRDLLIECRDVLNERTNSRTCRTIWLDEPVATVTECEACFTPDVCQLRGTCDYYTASQMRIATPPQSKPLTEEEIVDAVREADLDWQKGWTLDETQSNRFVTLVLAVERAHGIK